jgi:hypothetical protein
MTQFLFKLLLAGVAANAALTPMPGAAQGNVGPIKRLEMCPDDYSPKFSVKDGMCYPNKSAPSVYIPQRKGNCASGYRPNGPYCTTKVAQDLTPAADRLASYGTIAKANRLDRCPIGYFSKSDMTVCTTRLSPAPQSRRKASACKANEIDEWGLYCTANASAITRAQAEQEADRDFNAIYSANGAKGPIQTPSGDDTTNSAPMVAAYGRKGSGAASSSSDSQSASAPVDPNCTSPSSTGAALGGAIGGDAGAALGSMLGGLGKKKKKAGC